MAPRSRQVMLSCPSSLQSHSDFPTPVTSPLPASPDLMLALRSWSTAQALGSQVLPPPSVTACHWPYPGSPTSAHALCFLVGVGLLPIYRGSAHIPATQGLSLNQTLPAIPVRSVFTRLHHSLYATACGFGQHPRLGRTRQFSSCRLGTVSGQVRPVCYHTNPPPTYLSKRATDKTTSFQVAR